MRSSRIGVGALVATGLLTLAPGLASAAPKLRVQVSQNGDFVLLGNTLGQECAAGTPAPVVGNVGLCGLNTNDSSPDVFWRADSPTDGEATADATVLANQARSTAVLDVPGAGTVTHAFLYWAGTRTNPGTDMQITVDRPGGFSQDLDAAECYQSNNNSYHCAADVTALVQTEGEGAYRVSGVEIQALANANNNNAFGGWWMVVLFQDPAEPLRNLAVFDGLDPVTNGGNQDAVLSGFLVPNGGINGKLGIVTFEGDASLNGDQFFFNGGAALTDAENPANNFFNGTRSYLGNPVSVAGDLPQLTGEPQSMSGVDIDVVDITGKLMAGQTMAPISATSTQDVYYLAGFVTSVSDYRPNFTTSTKTAEDVNGGALLPGDVIQYTIHVVNTGNDTAVDVVLTDPLPPEVTYVPGSLEIIAGANTGAKTDDLADDQGEFDAGVVTFRLGTGADGTNGGSIPVGEATDVTFQVTVNDGVAGTINNQGLINAAGEMGAPPTDTPTDGNGGDDGNPPTGSVVDECETNADCTNPDEPVCNNDLDPNVCVECASDADCSPLEPTCDLGTGTCSCIPSGAEVCDAIDNDCNGEADEGFDVGAPCSAGEGECAADGVTVCDGPDAVTCGATPGEPTTELCDRLDNDCDGEIDNECVECGQDSDCGAADSGKVCQDGAGMCIDGCRGTNGNGCPDGFECTSQDDSIGMCVPGGATESDATNTDSNGSDSVPTEGSLSDTDSSPVSDSDTETNSDSAPTDGASATDSESNSDAASDTDSNGIDDEGFGCECNAENTGAGGPFMLLGLGGLALATRRRRR